jgi:hypothetical protein
MINAQTVTTPNGDEMTATDLDLLSGPELVSLYNLSADNLEEKHVRKFKDLATGRKRTWAILERYTTWINEEDEAQVDAEDEEDFDPDFDEPKTEVKVETVSGRMEGAVKHPQQIKRKRKSGVGAFIKQQLKAGETPKDIIEQVQEAYPDSKATTRDVAWYKSQMKKEQE